MSSIAVFAVLGGGAYATHTHRIGTEDLRNQAVTTPKLAQQAVGTGKLKPRAVGTGKLKARAVGTGKLKEGAVTTERLAALAVTKGKLANAAVGASQVGTIVWRNQAFSVAAGESASESRGCGFNERLLAGGGGFRDGGAARGLQSSRPIGPFAGPDQWEVTVRNNTASTQVAEVYVVCLQP